MSNAPVVAVVGATGYVGRILMPAFLEGLKDGKVKELRVLTGKAKLNSQQVKEYTAFGAKAFAVDYKNVSTVTAALKGVDAVVSTLSSHDGIEDFSSALLDALEAARVKLYFPSEFGTNHYKLANYNHPTFEAKRKHFTQAKERGLNPIRILTGCIMEFTFRKSLGFDCVAGVWTVVGNAADVPFGTTAERDLGRFTLEAVLLAHSNITKCPDAIEVYSDIKTLREYVKALDKVSNRETKIEQVDLAGFKNEYEPSQDFFKLLRLLFSDGVYDYSESTGNQLLNPNESVWKLKKFEEYAKETDGTLGNLT